MISQSSADTGSVPTDLASGRSCSRPISTYDQSHINFHPLAVHPTRSGNTYYGTLHQSEAHRILRVDLDRLEALVLVRLCAVEVRERRGGGHACPPYVRLGLRGAIRSGEGEVNGEVLGTLQGDELLKTS